MANVTEIKRRIAAKLDELATARDEHPTRATASVRHESAIIDIWSLRFQLAQLQLLTARGAEQIQTLTDEAATASRHIAEHEKRLVVARKSKDVDDEEDAAEHERREEALAGRLRVLASR